MVERRTWEFHFTATHERGPAQEAVSLTRVPFSGYFVTMNELRIIESRDRVEVYVGQSGHVCMAQDTGFEPAAIIHVHRDDVPRLIQYLQATYQEALDFVPEPETENHDG